MGGDLEGRGRSPKILGEGTAHASVTPIFGEVMLMKGHIWYISDFRQAKKQKRRSATKKRSSEIFG